MALIEKDNTYFKTPQEKPTDKIELEVGDSKQAEFYPQVKLARWDNEVNFSVRLSESIEGAKKKTEGDKITWEKKKLKAVFYDVDEGYEFEVHLLEKPASNVLSFSVETKGLDFFYQPALTPEEIAEGANRPENVVGSYAVYYKDCPMNYVGGKEYKAGKAFHIYRPWAEDSVGTRVWCDLNITDGLMTVTLPQTFVDTAVYPVLVDPTFGYKQVGASFVNIATQSSLFAQRVGTGFTPSAAGTLDSISAALKMNSNSDTLDVTVFVNTENTATNSHDEIAKVERTDLSLSTSAAFITFTANSESFSLGPYILNVVGDGADIANAADVARVAYDNGAFGTSYTAPLDTYANIRDQNPWLQAELGSLIKYSIYVTYSIPPTPIAWLTA